MATANWFLKERLGEELRIQHERSTPSQKTYAYFKDTTGGSRSYVTDRRNSPRVREHVLATSKESINLLSQGYAFNPGKSLAEKGFNMNYNPTRSQMGHKGFHASSLKMTKFNIPNAVTKRGGILGKSLGVIAMVGVNMLKKSAMGVNKGARVMVDYAATKGVLGAGRLGLMRESKMLKPPAGLVSALSRTRHGRG